jgi:class III poly(R)-hydroxyalkanoic acid synthase PhaE subunit
MSATKSAPGADWQQYWDNWFQGQRTLFDQQIKSAADLQGQWAGLFKEWQSSLSPSQPHAGAYQQFFAQAGQQYLDMMQSFYNQSGQNKPVGEMTSEWLRGLQQFFLTMLQSNTQPFDINEAYKNVTEAFQKGGSAWSHAFGQGGPFASAWNPQGWNAWQGGQQGFGANMWNAQGWGAPGLNTSAWNPQAAMNAFDPFGFYASLPGIGYTREKQDAWNDLYKRWIAFNAEVRKYNGAMAQVGLEAVHKFQDYVSNPPQGTEPLKSLKEIYGKWVDVCEEVYAKYAVSEEYTRLYGEVVNALMAYKGQANKLMDDLADQFNLPTRTEVDSLHQRLHALRRENIELRKAVDEIRGVKSPKAKPAGAPAQGGKKSSKKGDGK